MVVRDKYQRMTFDVTFEVIQSLPHAFSLLPPLLNLLSYTCGVKCLEVRSLWAGNAAFLEGDRITW